MAQPTRSARCESIANSRAAAPVSKGRSLLPPPTAACRLASGCTPVAFRVELDKTVDRRLALLQRAHDFVEPRERRFEAQLTDVLNRGHGSVSPPWLPESRQG